MRIDTLTYFSTSLAGIRDNQTAIARLNQQIASGQRLLAPKDDTLATEKVLQLSNRVATRTQHAANQDRAELSLKYEQTVIQEMQKALSTARGLLNISPFNDQALRNIHAEQLKGVFNQIVSLLDTRDPAGNYIFSGFETDTRPYDNTSLTAGTPLPTTYDGTPATPAPGGQRQVEIEEGRTVQINDNLQDVFFFNDGTFTDPVGGNPTHDFLQNLAKLIQDLPGNTITQADMNAYAAVIDKTAGKLELVEHRIAGAMSEVLDARGTTQALLLQERNALGDLQQVDQAAAIMELQTRQTTLQAASQAFSLTKGLSLFNYIGG